MTPNIKKKLGQLFFTGINSYKLTKNTKEFLKSIQPGGIIIFENNIKNKKQLKKLINNLNKILHIKPFIACDQEGGSIERLRKICTPVPSMWGLGKLGLNKLLQVQKIIISELQELGFNMNLAPVLDINSNPKNPVIGTRAISNKPLVVADYGKEIIKLSLKNKIIPVAKHFPGHGSLSTDSHLDLPTLDKSLKDLNRFEFIPFKHAIKATLPVIMVSHIQLSKIEKDKKKPSSLSKNVINDLLRKKLGYKGIVMTDELNMKGVTKYFSLNNAAFKALESGVNLLLFNSNEEKTLKVFNYLLKKAEKNKSFLNTINESYKKIIKTKTRFFNHKKTKFKKLKNNFNISYELTNKLIKWQKKDPSLFFPLNKTPISVIYPKTPKLNPENLKVILQKTGLRKYRLLNYNLNPGDYEIKRTIKKTSKSKNSILITYDTSAYEGQKKLVNQLIRLNSNLIAIGVGTEFDVKAVPKLKNYIGAYAPNYISLFCAFQRLIKCS